MTAVPIIQVDAFAHAPFTGNPAAVMPLEAWLDDATLQAIAAENNLAETAFTVPLPAEAGADYALRWFTPTVEIALCGHATLASGHVLMARGQEQLRFRTQKSGDLTVARAGEGYRLDLPAWSSVPAPIPDYAALLGEAAPIEARWSDKGYLILLYADATTIRRLSPDFTALRPLGDTLIIATAPGSNTDIVSRCFAPGAGIDEDPVTGAAHAGLTPYWTEKLGRPSFSAYQASARGGYVDCTLDGDRAILGGQCRTVIEGTFRL